MLLVVLLSIIRLPHIAFDNNVERMLPATPAIGRSIRFLRDSELSDSVALSVSLKHPQDDGIRLIEAVDGLAKELRGDLVEEVTTGVPQGDVGAGLKEVIAYTPQLIGPARVDALEHELDASGVEQRIGATYRRLITSNARPMRDILLADPLGIAGNLLKNMQDAATSFGYKARVVDGHLLSEDGSHALLLLKTSVAATDGFGARALLDHINACVERAPAPVEVLTIAAHRRTVSNENVIRRDVRRIGVVASLGFLFLFLLLFRDWRAIAVLVIPVLAIVVSIALSSLLLDALSYFIAGMSAVLVGIAIDYAIHVYVAKRTGGDQAVSIVARPITAGALTTMSVFFAFFFSDVSGYIQLACFSIVGLLICLLLSLLLLPNMVRIRPIRWVSCLPRFRLAQSRGGRFILVLAWLIAVGFLGISATRLVFQNDLTQFDGSEKAVLRDEEAFRRIWGGRDEPGILVVEGRELESVLERNDDIGRRAEELLGPGSLTTLASIWPSETTRSRNHTRWRAFWRNRGPVIKARMAAAREKYGFAEGAFDDFLEWADNGGVTAGLPDAVLLARLKDRFLHIGRAGVQAISYFEDTDANVQRLSALGAEDPSSVYIVSRRALGESISQAVSQESIRLSFIAGTLILVVLFLLVRNARLALLALTPVVTALIAISGILPLLGMPLTAASIIAAMIVLGLCIDYGVFMVHSEHRRAQCGTPLSVTLSAVTTLVGAGALLVADHPVMFSIGVTLVCGVAAGYLCAMWILPALYRMTDSKGWIET